MSTLALSPITLENGVELHQMSVVLHYQGLLLLDIPIRRQS